MEIRLENEFQEFLRSLNSNKVEYLLIGGYAVILNGHIRNTNDLDVCVSDNPENAKRVVKALVEFGFAVPDLDESLFTKPKSVVRMGFPPIKIEIINYLKGVSFQDAYRDRKAIRVGDLDISLINIDDLIANKRSVGRFQDLADVENLEKLR